MTNSEALGYMLLACKELRIEKETVRKIRKSMYYQFDIKTEDEADEQGHDWYYTLEE
ncbi:hypothetical protein ACFYKT_06345 [Cytobacillus sp. FJAT-53684]|uniref:MarR family transcriptional regulator n=1 Tax=Cytobacillus mangrovibacter TaxID=3299024 RepID=A0ABW6JVR9_9BACI